MATNVLLFAALRDAAGQREVTVEADTVAQLVEELAGQFGETFARRLSVASIVVDGDPTPRDSDRSLAGVREVAVLPPFSGGCRR